MSGRALLFCTLLCACSDARDAHPLDGAAHDAAAQPNDAGAPRIKTLPGTACPEDDTEQVLASAGGATRFVLDAEHLYFTGFGGLRRIPIAGGTAELLLEPASLSALAIDDLHVYAVSASGDLVAIDKQTRRHRTLATGVDSGDAIDADAEQVYFASDGWIRRVSRYRGPVTEVATIADQLVGLRAWNGSVYWIEAGLDETRVRSVDASSDDDVRLLATEPGGVSSLPSFVFEVDGEMIYWAAPSAIRAVAVAGGAVQTIATHRNATGQARIAVDHARLYVSEATLGGGILRARLEGGALFLLASAQLFPQAIAVDDAYVYWGERDGESIRRRSKCATASTE